MDFFQRWKWTFFFSTLTYSPSFNFQRAAVLWRGKALHLSGWFPQYSLWQSKWRLLRLPGWVWWTRCVFPAGWKLHYAPYMLDVCVIDNTFICRNCCLSQWQLPLHQCRFPADLHPILPHQWRNLRYEFWPVPAASFQGFCLSRIQSHVFASYTDCCDTTDEYNSGATCQNTCRWDFLFCLTITVCFTVWAHRV